MIDVGYAIKFVEEFTDPLTISHNNGDSSREDGQWWNFYWWDFIQSNEPAIRLMEAHNNKVDREVSY